MGRVSSCVSGKVISWLEHRNWIEKFTLTFKSQGEAFLPRRHLNKPEQAHRLASTSFLMRTKKDERGSGHKL